MNEILHLNSLLEDNTAQNLKFAKEKNMGKNAATIWLQKCSSLSSKNRSHLMEKFDSALVCDFEALTHVTTCRVPDILRDIKNCALQDEQVQKS